MDPKTIQAKNLQDKFKKHAEDIFKFAKVNKKEKIIKELKSMYPDVKISEGKENPLSKGTDASTVIDYLSGLPDF